MILALIFLAFSKDVPPRIFYPTSPLVAGSWLGLAPVIGLARQAWEKGGITFSKNPSRMKDKFIRCTNEKMKKQSVIATLYLRNG